MERGRAGSGYRLGGRALQRLVTAGKPAETGGPAESIRVFLMGKMGGWPSGLPLRRWFLRTTGRNRGADVDGRWRCPSFIRSCPSLPAARTEPLKFAVQPVTGDHDRRLPARKSHSPKAAPGHSSVSEATESGQTLDISSFQAKRP